MASDKPNSEITMVLASGNSHKLDEFREILCNTFNIPIKILSLKDVGFSQEIPETGTTFAENARQKAQTVAEVVSMPVIADDSGLEVLAIGGRPGVYSARFAGENATDQENNTLLLKEMQGKDDRRARFVANIALVYPDKGVYQVEGKCHGVILSEGRGENGFGYDPLFLVPELSKTLAEIAPKEKNRISHRWQALQKLKEILPKVLN